MSLPGMDVLGKLNPVCQGPIFTQMVLDKLDLERLLKGLDNPEDKKLRSRKLLLRTPKKFSPRSPIWTPHIVMFSLHLWSY